MAGFFIPGIGQGGGANPNPNPDAFTQARFDAQTNELVLTTAGGVAIRVNLQGLVPNVVQGTIENIRIDGTNIVVTTVAGQQIQLPLSRVLNGTDVTFTPTANINSNTVSDAIIEVDGKINNAYTNANFNIANGELTLNKQNGQNTVLDLSDLMGVREFDYNDVAKKITVLDHTGARVEVDLSKFATEVNGKPVVNGSVTVVAGDIGYNGQTSGVQANNVQDAIDELKKDIALLDNSDIFIVPNEAEMNVLLQTPNALKKGDLIYVVDSTNVVDFDNQDVSNNGKPVAMIYDDGVTGNHLRLFSKVDTTITLSADNVSFAPTQHITSVNVQEALVEVSGKTITNGTINGNNLELTRENGAKVDIDVTRLIGINTINTESPDTQGNINLALEIAGDELQFKVNNNAKNTLELYTDADANTLIQYFV